MHKAVYPACRNWIGNCLCVIKYFVCCNIIGTRYHLELSYEYATLMNAKIMHNFALTIEFWG